MADVLEDLKDLLHEASSTIQTIAGHGKDDRAQDADASEHKPKPKKPKAQDRHLSSWAEDAPAIVALKEFVADVTDKNSPNYIDPKERIAVSDFDGTLFCELDPTYFDWAMSVHRVLYDTTYEATPDQIAAAKIIEEVERTGISPSDSMVMQANMAGEAYCGMTSEELWDYTLAFGDELAPGFTGMNRREAYYVPMLELIDYLQDNEFVFYVVSGTDRTIARALIKDKINIPPANVIGSDNEMIATGQSEGDDSYTWDGKGGDRLVYSGGFVVKDINMNKVTAIAREICIKPVVAMGNSTGDSSMISYVVNDNPHRALGLFVLADDAERERGDVDKAAKLRQRCDDEGWIAISTRDDWKTIYGAGVELDRDWVWDHPDATGPNVQKAE